MAISEDTAALVAAQLTLAYAKRMGVKGNAAHTEVRKNLVEVYQSFREAVAARRDITTGRRPIAGV